MKKSKSTIKIPTDATGSVPHWCPLEDECNLKIQDYQDSLAEGFKPSSWNPSWTEEAWRNWCEDGIKRHSYTWSTPEEFSATLKITGFARGRSAAYFTLQSTSSQATYCMFITDMTRMLSDVTINKGVISGRWICCKRGQNYGVQYLGPADEGGS